MSTTYKCTLSRQGNGLTISWVPAKPADPAGFGHDDIVQFTSADEEWKISFKTSPFADDPDGAVRSFRGKKGESDGTALGKMGLFPFSCGLFDGTKWVGWGITGDQMHVGH